MKVVNVAGFNVRIERDGKIYNIPNDGSLHVVPDSWYFSGDNFQGLLRVIIPPEQVRRVVREMITPTNSFVDINDPTIKEIVIDRVEEKIEEKNNKPLKGKRLKSSVRNKLAKKGKSTTIEE